MKIVITSQGPDLEADVDPRFGRAPFFLVYDLEADTCEPIDNEVGRSSGQGAGVQAAQTVVGQGVEALLTGHCGPKAFELLASSGITIYTDVDGRVRDAVEKYRRGKLTAGGGPDVEGHWS